ncbi:MAG: type II toxin-antitoxin system Phd/YefM family antitoxin [Candidatus Liptonbacteria bacterium]|nr:type II toxin-antitoxin system Phd/YefM family antitoxin [Candidatus Liptonbacteria bacterium]
MNIKTTLPISEARKRIFAIAKDVQKPSQHYTLTDKGIPKAVILSAEEFESWVETLEVLQDFPDLIKDVREAERQYKNGEYKTWKEIKRVYVSPRSTKKSSKRNK